MLEEYIELEIRIKYGDHAENFYVKKFWSERKCFFLFHASFTHHFLNISQLFA